MITSNLPSKNKLYTFGQQLCKLNPKKGVENLRVGIQVYYQGKDVILIWGINILHDNEKSNGVLLKFLESENFNPITTMRKIISTINWREEFEVQGLFDRKSGLGFSLMGVDNKGQPLCYVKLKDWCDNKSPFLSICGCWVQLLEKAVQRLNFSDSFGVSSIFRLVDLTDTSKTQKKCLWEAFRITNEYYPDIIKDELYIGDSSIPSSIRKGNSFVYSCFAYREIFKYIPVMNVPSEHGGIPTISDDSKYEIIGRHMDISKYSRQDVVFYCSKGSEFTLRVRVIGWDVSFGVNFFGASEEHSRLVLNFYEPGPYVEFKMINVEEDGILLLSVYNNKFSTKKLVSLLSSFPKGFLKEINVGKDKPHEKIQDLQQQKAYMIYSRVKKIIRLEHK